MCFLYDNCNHKDCDADFCLRRYKCEELFKAARLSKKQQTDIKLVLDSDMRDRNAFETLSKIRADIATFVAEGKNLYIYSTICGNGKTSWAEKLVRAYLTSIWARADISCHALIVSVPSYLSALKQSFTDYDENVEYINKNINTAELVVFDDIASKAGSQYDLDKLFSIINYRYEHGLANIFTSNLSPEILGTALGPRLASRIANGSTCVQFVGGDKRQRINC